MFKEDEYLVLEDNVRHSYMSVVWSHKIQEKQADILTNYYKKIRDCSGRLCCNNFW